MKYLFATMTLLGLLAVSFASANAANSHVESALAKRDDLSTFHRALINTGVANELKENTEYTLFAPTNEAFAQIQPRAYPCFFSYSAQCRHEESAILRNHIVTRNENIRDLSKWGKGVATLGDRRLYVAEPYKGEYTVEGHHVLSQSKGDKVSLYVIDAVMASDQEIALFPEPPVANNSYPEAPNAR
jgi:uncharacterized surface protein with fasciclin (FAS1) repeats